eukprot:COSAG02_NODE_166_length_31947_cov_34.168617_18_plen_183_part_00
MAVTHKATTESRQKHARTSVLAALPLPRHGESAAADLAASYTGLRIPVLPIECAWTHASAISMGAVAVFRAFSTSSPAAGSLVVTTMMMVWMVRAMTTMVIIAYIPKRVVFGLANLSRMHFASSFGLSRVKCRLNLRYWHIVSGSNATRKRARGLLTRWVTLGLNDLRSPPTLSDDSHDIVN